MATHTDTKGIHTPAPKGQMLNYYDNNPYAQPKRFHYPTKALLGCGSANSAVVLGAATIIRETTRYLSPVSLLAELTTSSREKSQRVGARSPIAKNKHARCLSGFRPTLLGTLL